MRLGRTSYAASIVLLLAVFLFHAITTIVLLPFGRGADERDHFIYVNHLFIELALPDPRKDNVAQAQHPPLPYVAFAVIMWGLDHINVALGDDAFVGRNWSMVAGRKTLFTPELEAWRLYYPTAADRPTFSEERLNLHIRLRAWELYALRGVSLTLGIATFFLILMTARLLLPGRPWTALLATAAVTTVPQFAWHFSIISNDSWLAAWAAWTAYYSIRAAERDRLDRLSTRLWIGFFLGVGFLMKLHFIGIAFFAFLLVWRRSKKDISFVDKIGRVLPLVLLPMIVAGWWHLRQLMLQGSLLAAESHARFRPSLFRLDRFHPIQILDLLEEMARSFFGSLGHDQLMSHGVYYYLPIGMALTAIAGAIFLRCEPGVDVQEGEMPKAPRARSIACESLAGAFLLFCALNVSNMVYYHFNGRYMWAILIPLVGVMIEGLDRWFGKRLAVLLSLLVAWSIPFTSFSTWVVVAKYSIDAEKVTRGRVATYYDCGLEDFDQESARGAPSTWKRKILMPPEYSTRYDVQFGPAPTIRYKMHVPKPERRWQIRLRYPSMQGRDGDVPQPTANCLLVNSWNLHGPQSFWNTFGETRYFLPEPLAKAADLEVWWENHAPSSAHVACAEIWLEEAWLQLATPPSTTIDGDKTTVRCIVENVDTIERHIVDVIVYGGSKILAEKRNVSLAPGSQQPLELPLSERPASESPIFVRLFDRGMGPWANLKIFPWTTSRDFLSGTPRVPDIDVVRVPFEKKSIVETAKIKLPRLPDGDYLLSIGYLGDRDPFADGSLMLVMDGCELDMTIEKRTANYGKDVSLSCRKFRRPPPNERDAFVSIVTTGTGPDSPILLDRLIVECLASPTAPGPVYEIAAGPTSQPVR